MDATLCHCGHGKSQHVESEDEDNYRCTSKRCLCIFYNPIGEDDLEDLKDKLTLPSDEEDAPEPKESKACAGCGTAKGKG